MIGFSIVPQFDVRLPTASENDSSLMLSVSIRDTYDCAAEYNLTSVMVVTDTAEIDQFIASIQTPIQIQNTQHSNILRVLNSGNQNAISQITTSLVMNFNRIGSEIVRMAISSAYILFR